MITFLWPLAFLLLPLPYLAWRFPKPVDPGLAGALKVPFFEALRARAVDGQNGGKPNLLKLATLTLVWILLVTALARPAFVGREIPLPVEGRDIMMAIDLSGSMEERDFAVGGRPATRLNIVKETADDFISRREGDRLGLVLFSDRAYLQAPLTFDREAVRTLLDQAQVGLTGQKTAIGDAIAVSVKRLMDRSEDGRVLVLLTDGANNEGVMSPDKAADLAADLGIRIYTIGVGSARSRDLDERTLRQIADTTGGAYFRATDVQGLAQIYRAIDRLEPVAGDPIHLRPEIDLYYWPAGAALVLSALLALFSLIPAPLRRESQGA